MANKLAVSKKTIVLFVFFLLVYLIYLIAARAPASLVADAVHKAVPNLWLTSVTGTAWSGVARGAQIDIANEALPMGAFRWKINPWSLVRGQLCVKFDSQFVGRPLDGNLCRSLNGDIRVSNLNLEAPLNLLEGMVPVKMTGQASLQVVDAKVTGIPKRIEIHRLDARLTLQGLRLDAGTGWMTMGTYAAVIKESDEKGISAKIMDIDAPFGIDMQGSWQFGQAMPIVKGTVSTTPQSPQDVISAIEVIGEEKERGVYYIEL